MKTEKRMKKVLEQLALKKMDSDDTPLGMILHVSHDCGRCLVILSTVLMRFF